MGADMWPTAELRPVFAKQSAAKPTSARYQFRPALHQQAEYDVVVMLIAAGGGERLAWDVREPVAGDVWRGEVAQRPAP